MKYRVMITSLYRGDSNEGVKYYYTRQDERKKYCDAMLSAEASCKYVLSNYKIDEILTFGTKSTHDEGDELIPIVLREGKSFYASDTKNLSTYSLLRYRLAEFLDEIEIEKQDIRELVSEKEEEILVSYVKRFFREVVNCDGNYRFNRFFEILTEDKTLWMKLCSSISYLAGNPIKAEKYKLWISRYLYDEMRDSSKMEELDCNDDVKIRFIPIDRHGGTLIVDSLVKCIMALAESHNDNSEDDVKPEIELYICMQSDDASDNTVLMNFIEAVRALPSTNIEIVQINTTSKRPDSFANRISDDTTKFGMNDLLAGTRAFLQYGKTDILMDYWGKQGIHNDFINRMLYAMRNIDVGISLCDITDIERGISSLRNLFSDPDAFKPTTFVENFFALVIEGIHQDYGPLITKDEMEFIDLVKWAFRKGFWQQTLTLIESRAPQDLLSRGMYYYCNSEEGKPDVIKKFGQIYFDLRPFEKYKLDDIPHYYLKFYGRWRVGNHSNDTAHQLEYTDRRLKDLEETSDEFIRAYTLCDDRHALHELLYSYYNVGTIRNITNHADGDVTGLTYAREDSEIGERMNKIKHAIEFFIKSYDDVRNIIDSCGRENDVVEIEAADIVGYSNFLRAELKKSKYGKGKYKDNKDPDTNKDTD